MTPCPRTSWPAGTCSQQQHRQASQPPCQISAMVAAAAAAAADTTHSDVPANVVHSNRVRRRRGIASLSQHCKHHLALFSCACCTWPTRPTPSADTTIGPAPKKNPPATPLPVHTCQCILPPPHPKSSVMAYTLSWSSAASAPKVHLPSQSHVSPPPPTRHTHVVQLCAP
jgi:hypothetical protein